MSKLDKTLEQEFKEYSDRVLPPNATPDQVNDAKIAFYTGSAVMLAKLNEAFKNEDDEVSNYQFAMLVKEVHEFVTSYIDQASFEA